MVLILLLLVSSIPNTVQATETLGCSKNQKNKFTNLLSSETNSVCGVFCETLNCDEVLLEPNDNGFYEEGGFACRYFNQNNKKTNVIAIFSKAVLETGTFVYPQATEQTGLFLTKTLKSLVDSDGVQLSTLVDTVIPQHMTQSDAAQTVAPECEASDGTGISSSAPLDDTVYTKVVHCTFSKPCTDLNRDCDEGGVIKVRTTSTTFQADVSLSKTYEVENEMVFLTDTEEHTFSCESSDDGTYKWYNNAALIDNANQNEYLLTHNGQDTTIQCVVDADSVNKIVTWNVFTVEPFTVTGSVTETVTQVVHDEPHTFPCSISPDPPPTFPSPFATWRWVDEGDPVVKLQTVKQAPNFEYTTTIQFTDYGNYRCYLSNGVGEEALAKNFKTEFVVDTKVESLIPDPVNWYEYITAVPEVYYVKADPITLKCVVEKEEDYVLLWMFPGEEALYYYDKDEPTDAKTKKVSTATPSNNWAESLEEESSWEITQQDVPDTRGFHNEQTFTTPTYLESMDTEVEELEAMCFLVPDTTETVLQLTDKVTEYLTTDGQTDDIKKLYKTLSLKFYSITKEPTVKGPLNQIESNEVEKLTMNCRVEDGIPPSFVYFMLKTNKSNDLVNVNDQLAKSPIDDKYLRYEITRESDILTVLTIKSPTDEDEGGFTCCAINRGSAPDVIEGPKADVVIEEKCAEGAKFCFNGGRRTECSMVGIVVVFQVLHWWIL